MLMNKQDCRGVSCVRTGNTEIILCRGVFSVRTGNTEIILCRAVGVEDDVEEKMSEL